MSTEGENAGGAASPWFARLGQEALDRGNPGEALRLCAAGVEQYPWYATGFLVLGKALDALGRGGESVLAFRRGLEASPDAAVARGLLRQAEEREREAFAGYAERQSEALETTPLTFEEYSTGTGIPGEGSAGFLQNQALAAKQEEPAQEPAPILPEKSAGERIVTVTLAEIYASQGEYREALEAYRALKALRPAEAGRFDDRIRRLEELAAEQNKPLE